MNLGLSRWSISTCGSAKLPAPPWRCSLLRAALACHTGMATFAEAGVSDKPADDAAAPKAAG